VLIQPALMHHAAGGFKARGVLRGRRVDPAADQPVVDPSDAARSHAIRKDDVAAGLSGNHHGKSPSRARAT
jgi:hypothetical protein